MSRITLSKLVDLFLGAVIFVGMCCAVLSIIVAISFDGEFYYTNQEPSKLFSPGNVVVHKTNEAQRMVVTRIVGDNIKCEWDEGRDPNAGIFSKETDRYKKHLFQDIELEKVEKVNVEYATAWRKCIK